MKLGIRPGHAQGRGMTTRSSGTHEHLAEGQLVEVEGELALWRHECLNLDIDRFALPKRSGCHTGQIKRNAGCEDSAH
jgi:hypothetical protein